MQDSISVCAVRTYHDHHARGWGGYIAAAQYYTREHARNNCAWGCYIAAQCVSIGNSERGTV